MRSSGKDMLCWKVAKRRGFEVKGYYWTLISTIDDFYLEVFGRLKCHSCILFLGPQCWGKSWESIIWERDILLWSIGVVCVIEVGRLWIIYFFPWLVYGLWTVWFQLVMLKSILELLACWQGHFGWHWHLEIWKAVPYCFMWCL